MRPWLAATALVAAVPGVARADHVSVHATLVGTLAATNNVLNAQDGTPADGDIFVQVRPGVLLVYETPRMIQELVAEVEALEFVRHNDQPSASVHGASRAFYTPGPLSSLATVVDVSTGQVSALTSRSAPDATGVALLPTTLVYTENGTASETASKVVGLGTSIHETGAAVYAYTTDDGAGDPIRHQPNLTLVESLSLFAGVTHTWPFDSLQLDLGAAFLHLEDAAPLGSPPGSDRLDRELNPQVTSTWKHDYDKRWSSVLTGGLIVVNPVGIDPFNPTLTLTQQYYPIATGQVAYTDDWGRVVATVSRNVAPNLFIAQNTLNDTALVQVLLPIPIDDDFKRGPPHLVASASLGVSQTTLLDQVMGTNLGAFDIVHADAGVLWTPRLDTTYGVRAEYFKQLAENGANVNTNAAAEQFFSFSRATIFFTVAIRWPARLAAQVPQQQSLRADGRDTAQPGEVVVPDEPTELTGGPDGGGSR